MNIRINGDLEVEHVIHFEVFGFVAYGETLKVISPLVCGPDLAHRGGAMVPAEYSGGPNSYQPYLVLRHSLKRLTMR